MGDIPDLGDRSPVSAKMPAAGASNGVASGQTAQVLRGQGSVGCAQEAEHQPTVQAHPQGPFVARDGSRYRTPSQ